jgi:hypothetical protein
MLHSSKMSLEMSSQMSCYCCCECCDYYVFCDWCIALCDCECDYDCNCLAKYWFCNIDVCFPCIKTAILPCVLAILIPFTSFCIAQHLVVAFLCCACSDCTSTNGDINPCIDQFNKCEECDDACFWTPCIKMWSELICCDKFMGYEKWENNTEEQERYFECTSHTKMKEMFFTKSVTVQPVMQTNVLVRSVSTEIPPPYHAVSDFSEISPPYEEVEGQGILPIDFNSNIRIQWSPVSEA